jgi:hypothetical protein
MAAAWNKAQLEELREALSRAVGAAPGKIFGMAREARRAWTRKG